jgi:hypothetical protein
VNQSFAIAIEVPTMPTPTLTDEQVIDLVMQLPEAAQRRLMQALLTRPWASWRALSQHGAAGVLAAAAQRGYDWDAMNEEEREAFIDDVLHEDC